MRIRLRGFKRIKGEIMGEKRLSEFLKENGTYESFIENCLNDEETLESLIENELINISIFNGFLWEKTKQGGDYWAELQIKANNAHLKYDMDEIIYKEYERRNMKNSLDRGVKDMF